MFFFFTQKTAYELRISDWSSDVCSSDLVLEFLGVSPDHEPQYAVVNSARVIRSVPLHRWLIKPPIDLWNPERLLPSGRLAHGLQWRAQTLRSRLYDMNLQQRRRPPMRPEPRARLQPRLQVGRASGRERGCQYV